VDSFGSAYVTGHTNSTDFPTTPGSFQTTFGGSFDAFVTKLNPTGSGLIYSTYLGGSGDDESNAIAVDATGSAYVTGLTTSPFPTTPGAFQTIFGGVNDAFVTKLNPTGSGLVYSTYLGGSGNDTGEGIAVDSLGNAYVTGLAASTFPTTPAAFQTIFGGGIADVFVTKIDPAGSLLVYSTYLGGSGDDVGLGITVDGSGNAYVTGDTTSIDLSTTPGAFQTIYGGAHDAFVTKLDSAGSALVYSTYLGGSGDDAGFGIAVDGSGNAYVTGITTSADFPTLNAMQSIIGGGFDAYLTKLNPTGSGLVYSTYLGGSGYEQGRGIALDGMPNPNAYVVGLTGSTDFPTTIGALQTTFGGASYDAFVTKIADISGGAFVIGDRDAVVGNTVTFWGAQWAKANSLSGGPVPKAFKGFAETTPQRCGGSWTSDPGNSSKPPDSLPPYLAVIVSSSVTKAGSTISGDVPKIIIVKTDPGYGPSPGHTGTDTVVSVLCGR
jgi:Beta-propeller repeat